MPDHSTRNHKHIALDPKDLTPEEFKSLCDIFATLLKWDREEKAKDKDTKEGRGASISSSRPLDISERSP
jgi:hypothetical protein